MKRFEFIAGACKDIPLERLCQTMGVSSRGFRAWRSRPISQRQRDDMVLLANIREQYALSLQTYGRPRMTVELQELGFDVSERRVGRLMRDNAIQAVRSRRYKRTTDSNHGLAIQPNVLDRDFTAQKPNEKWGVDISYLWTNEGWLYLAVVMDLFSRKIIGWAASYRMKKDLAIEALRRAIALRKPPRGCLHHSDKGSQYCGYDYQKILRDNGFIVSMSGTGNCFDNAVDLRRENSPPDCFLILLTLFKTLKAEYLWRHQWQTRQQVVSGLFQYINGFYNLRRRHSALRWKSPEAIERLAA